MGFNSGFKGLINTLYKSSCCCGDKLLFSLTLPRNYSAVIISHVPCVQSLLCMLCVNSVSLRTSRRKTQRSFISSIHNLPIFFIYFVPCSTAIVSDVTFLVLRKGIYFITTKFQRSSSCLEVNSSYS